MIAVVIEHNIGFIAVYFYYSCDKFGCALRVRDNRVIGLDLICDKKIRQLTNREIEIINEIIKMYDYI